MILSFSVILYWIAEKGHEQLLSLPHWTYFLKWEGFSFVHRLVSENKVHLTSALWKIKNSEDNNTHTHTLKQIQVPKKKNLYRSNSSLISVNTHNARHVNTEFVQKITIAQFSVCHNSSKMDILSIANKNKEHTTFIPILQLDSEIWCDTQEITLHKCKK